MADETNENHDQGAPPQAPTIEQELADLKAQLVAHETKIDALGSTASELASLKTEVDSLGSTVAGHTTNISTLHSTIATTQRDIQQQGTHKPLEDPELVAKLSEYGIK